jgi:hypothetical protein
MEAQPLWIHALIGVAAGVISALILVALGLPVPFLILAAVVLGVIAPRAYGWLIKR